MAEDVSVLIVDDSALMRNLISHMVEDTAGLKVADKAMNGRFALQKIPLVNPDVIVLDLEMPEMNGIEFLKERRKQGIKIPVVILSSLAAKGAEITMEALALGASDFVQKPSGSISQDISKVKESITPMLLAYGGLYQRTQKHVPKAVSPPVSGSTASRTASILSAIAEGASALDSSPLPTKPPVPTRRPGNTEIIAIGISTGGPDALRVVCAGLDADLKQPILVVQHMPAGFTAEFAKSLDRICPLEVKEAEEGDLIRSGRILIAPGNRHIEVERKSLAAIVHLSDAPPVNGHRPSADVLFASVAMAYTNHVLGVIMTGMGRDGASQLGTIFKEGGITLGQDEASSVVYGMPRVAYELGHVMEQVSLEKMARRICDTARQRAS